jgi:hypothetical protein
MVFQTPPIPPIQKLQAGFKTSVLMDGDYSANVNYSFWVSYFQVNMWVYVVLLLTLIIVMSS